MPVVVGVLLVWLVPTLLFGYPLFLLGLALAGPLSVGGPSVRRALVTSAVAGCVSAVVGVGALVLGADVLGSGIRTLDTQASMAPMPTWLPQLMAANGHGHLGAAGSAR